MSISFTCPSCQSQYTVNNDDAGKKSNCKKCGQRLQVPAPPKATIQFGCPTCKTSYTVGEEDAGKKSACKKCGQRLQVPGSQTISRTMLGEVNPDSALSPSIVPDLSATVTPPAETPYVAENEAPALVPISYSQRVGRAPTSPASRIVAAIGASLLFIGLFLPMLQAPMGISLSFIDVPWKAVTVGFAVADEIQDRQKEPEVVPRTERRKIERKENEKPDHSGLVVLVAIASVLYPLFILAAIGISALQIAQGRTAKYLLFIGIACFASTLGYGLSILTLNSIPELRLVMALISPGFGWAVLIIGTALLMASGAIRFEKT